MSLTDFLEYSVIRDLRRQDSFAPCLAENGIGNTGLPEALQALRRDLGVRFIFIMDEWDLVYREHRDDPRLQQDFSALLQDLFNSAEGLDCFALAYLTGILSVRKQNSRPILDHADEHNMLSPGGFAPYFGFTGDEVADIVRHPRCRIALRELRAWYEGYRISGLTVYSPWAIISAVSRNECSCYWIGTSSNEEAGRLISMDFAGLKEDILDLLAGREISFSCLGFRNDMDTLKTRDDVICLLVCLGYLGCQMPDAGGPGNGSSEDGSGRTDQKTKTGDITMILETARDAPADPAAKSAVNSRRTAYVPNAEIMSLLTDIVRELGWLA